MEAFTPFAEQLADTAASIVRKAYDSASIGTKKADQSLVTDTDKAIESSLSKMILNRYPDHGVYGEEHERINPDAFYQWVIDPIDGTNAFIARIPTFTTLIALCKDGIPIMGIIAQPILNQRWVHSKIKPSGRKHDGLASVVLGTTSMAYFTAPEMQKFINLRNACGGSVHAGDAYLYAQLTGGHVGVVADSGMKPYDFCALVPVIHAAGGVITDWQGNPLSLNSKGDVLAAATPELHAEALKVLEA